MYRFKIEIDQSPIDTGDLFTAECLPDLTEPQRAFARLDYIREIENNGGPWGFVIETRCEECGQWEQVSSCWGFDCLDYCENEAKEEKESFETATTGTRGEK